MFLTWGVRASCAQLEVHARLGRREPCSGPGVGRGCFRGAHVSPQCSGRAGRGLGCSSSPVPPLRCPGWLPGELSALPSCLCSWWVCSWAVEGDMHKTGFSRTLSLVPASCPCGWGQAPPVLSLRVTTLGLALPVSAAGAVGGRGGSGPASPAAPPPLGAKSTWTWCGCHASLG